jgi:hypothetical protein
MPTIVEIMGERRKELGEPIIKHLLETADDPVEASMVLLLCMTEIVARAIQSQNPHEIAVRMREFTDGWITMLEGGQPPKDPNVPSLLQ